MFESRVRKTALQMRRMSQEILLLHVVEGSHMQTKPITEDEDPWIPTAQQDQETLSCSFKFAKKNKLESVEIITCQICSIEDI